MRSVVRSASIIDRVFFSFWLADARVSKGLPIDWGRDVQNYDTLWTKKGEQNGHPSGQTIMGGRFQGI